MTEQDFRGVTIDAAHSRDLDDAVWVERAEMGWKVTVSIALACAAVHKGSTVDLAARSSGFSRYSAEAVSRPMLPKILSEDGLSLTPGKPHQVLAFVINLDEILGVTHLEMGIGRLVHEGRLSHEQAGELVDGGPERLHRMLGDAWELCSGLLEARRRSGALATSPPDLA